MEVLPVPLHDLSSPVTVKCLHAAPEYHRYCEILLIANYEVFPNSQLGKKSYAST